MRKQLQANVVFRAVQIKGGAAALAQAIDIPLREVQAWMLAESSVPESVYLELLDMICEDTLRQLSTNASGDDGRRGA